MTEYSDFDNKGTEIYNYLLNFFKENRDDVNIFWMAASTAFTDYMDFLAIKAKLDVREKARAIGAMSMVSQQLGYIMGVFANSSLNNNENWYKEYEKIIKKRVEEELIRIQKYNEKNKK